MCYESELDRVGRGKEIRYEDMEVEKDNIRKWRQEEEEREKKRKKLDPNPKHAKSWLVDQMPEGNEEGRSEDTAGGHARSPLAAVYLSRDSASYVALSPFTSFHIRPDAMLTLHCDV